MRSLLTPIQGRIVRALVLFLSKGSEHRLSTPEGEVVIETVSSCEWASLTFSGHRHHLVIRWPAGTERRIDLDEMTLDLSGAIVAVERAAWTATDAGLHLTIDLLEIADTKNTVVT